MFKMLFYIYIERHFKNLTPFIFEIYTHLEIELHNKNGKDAIYSTSKRTCCCLLQCYFYYNFFFLDPRNPFRIVYMYNVQCTSNLLL